MNDQELKKRAHELDVTVWIGKGGLDAVVDELDDQLSANDVVKVKFLRAARAGETTEVKAVDLAERVNADLVDTRGHTAVLHR